MESNQSILWSIKITVRIVLAERDVASLEHPRPLYFQVSRQSYLNILLPQIQPLWQHLLPPQLHLGSNAPWFAYNSLPLKWDTPLGVLYDLLVPDHDEEPWELCLHFRDYPLETLPPYVNEASLQDSLRNSLKEASVITSGSATQVISMVSGAHEDLWKAVVRSDVATLKRIFNSIQLNVSSHEGASHNITQLPVRLYIRVLTKSGSEGAEDKDYLSSYESIYRTSRPLQTHNPEDGSPHTLRSVLSPLLVQHLARKDDDTQGSCVWNHIRHLWVGGTRPPDDATLKNLFEEFHCADYFLYIVMHVQRD